MPHPSTPTLDQLRVFLTVVETGSFASAARKLGRATSVISYAVANLEAQLGLALFDRKATRKPQLTVAGRAVLGEARTVAHGIDGLRAKVRGLLGGLEAEVNLAVDVMLPTPRIVDALKAFQQEFPTVALRLHVEALGAVAQLVLDRTAVLGVSGPLASGIDGLERVEVGMVELIPVARPDHPLAGEAGTVPGAARDHVQLVLTDRSTLTEGRDFAVVGTRTWRLADLGAKHALLLAGLGWGNMPAPMVADDLRDGRLVRLRLAAGAGEPYRFQAIYRTETPPGPAGAWLLAQLHDQA
ncbi:MAG: LysR family transcriptional regulator [Geminicoccaceae bacterium]